LVKKIAKKSSKKGKNVKNDIKNTKKPSIKSNLNSKKLSNKPKVKKTIKAKVNPKNKKSIVVKRSSGRKEKFGKDKLTQTVRRSGVSFPVAKDTAKSSTKKITKPNKSKSIIRTTTKKQKTIQQPTQKNKSTPLAITKQKSKISSKTEPENMIFTTSQVKNLVQDEIKDRDQQDSPSFSGNVTVEEEPSTNITLYEKEPVMDIVETNKNKIPLDPSEEKESSEKSSFSVT